MIPGEIFTSFAEFQGIVSVNDFRLPVRLQELLQASLCFLWSFCFTRIRLNPLSCQVLHHDCISVIVSRFAMSLRTLRSAVIKPPNLSARGTASPLRLLHGALVILVGLQISQFQSLGKWVWTLRLPRSSRLFVVGSKEASWKELACTIASSCVCTSPLAVMTIVGLHDFVKVSISASLKSLVADHMHRRSGVHNKFSFLRFKSWCREAPIFRRWEECCSFLLLEFQHTFGQLPRCFAGTLLLPLYLLLRPILKFWSVGATLMRFRWANIYSSEGFWSRILVSRAINSLCKSHTLDWFPHVCALPENRLRRRHVLKYTTQLPCIR